MRSTGKQSLPVPEACCPTASRMDVPRTGLNGGSPSNAAMSPPACRPASAAFLWCRAASDHATPEFLERTACFGHIGCPQVTIVRTGAEATPELSNSRLSNITMMHTMSGNIALLGCGMLLELGQVSMARQAPTARLSALGSVRL